LSGGIIIEGRAPAAPPIAVAPPEVDAVVPPDAFELPPFDAAIPPAPTGAPPVPITGAEPVPVVACCPAAPAASGPPPPLADWPPLLVDDEPLTFVSPPPAPAVPAAFTLPSSEPEQATVTKIGIAHPPKMKVRKMLMSLLPRGGSSHVRWHARFAGKTSLASGLQSTSR
jgi:hypothetical protein